MTSVEYPEQPRIKYPEQQVSSIIIEYPDQPVSLLGIRSNGKPVYFILYTCIRAIKNGVPGQGKGTEKGASRRRRRDDGIRNQQGSGCGGHV